MICVNWSRFYITMTSLYRLGVIGVVIAMDILAGFNYEKEKLLIYVLFGLYAIIFSVVRINKWVSYAELFGVITLLYFFTEPNLHFLLLIPFTNFVSSQAEKWDILLFSGITTWYIYYKFDNVMMTVVLALGIVFTLYIFHQRFNQIEKLSNELFKSKDEIKEYRNEITTQKLEFEITMKMFYHMRELSEAEKEEQVIKKMLYGSKAFFNAMYACLYTIDEEGEYYVRNMEDGETKRYTIPETLNITGSDIEPTFTNEMMRMPIFISGQDWGIIAIYGKRMAIGNDGQLLVSPFHESDYETMLTYIYSVTKRIAELQISQQNLFLANNDFLTKIPNRRYFWEQLDRMVYHGQRGDDFAVLMMDIDNFKQINDTFGHDVGDSVLKIVAETIGGAIRKTDIVGRIGGEEFAVILYKPKNEAMMVAERIRKMVASIPFEGRQITLSIGLAYFGKHGDTIEELMKNVDVALYEAKHTGKNKIVEYHYTMSKDEI